MSWVKERTYNRNGKVIEEVVVCDLDPKDILDLLDVDGQIRHVSLSVKFDQQNNKGTISYVPATARAYVTVGEAR